jgi:hypothetical protein
MGIKSNMDPVEARRRCHDKKHRNRTYAPRKWYNELYNLSVWIMDIEIGLICSGILLSWFFKSILIWNLTFLTVNRVLHCLTAEIPSNSGRTQGFRRKQKMIAVLIILILVLPKCYALRPLCDHSNTEKRSSTIKTLLNEIKIIQDQNMKKENSYTYELCGSTARYIIMKNMSALSEREDLSSAEKKWLMDARKNMSYEACTSQALKTVFDRHMCDPDARKPVFFPMLPGNPLNLYVHDPTPGNEVTIDGKKYLFRSFTFTELTYINLHSEKYPAWQGVHAHSLDLAMELLKKGVLISPYYPVTMELICDEFRIKKSTKAQTTFDESYQTFLTTRATLCIYMMLASAIVDLAEKSPYKSILTPQGYKVLEDKYRAYLDTNFQEVSNYLTDPEGEDSRFPPGFLQYSHTETVNFQTEKGAWGLLGNPTEDLLALEKLKAAYALFLVDQTDIRQKMIEEANERKVRKFGARDYVFDGKPIKHFFKAGKDIKPLRGMSQAALLELLQMDNNMELYLTSESATVVKNYLKKKGPAQVEKESSPNKKENKRSNSLKSVSFQQDKVIIIENNADKGQPKKVVQTERGRKGDIETVYVPKKKNQSPNNKKPIPGGMELWTKK